MLALPEEPTALLLVGKGLEEQTGLLDGLVLELRQGEQLHRAVSDPQGRFAFERLPPGEWQLEASRGNLPEGYRLEGASHALRLVPGGTTHVEIRLVPLERRLEIQDGGAVPLSGCGAC